MKFEDLQVNNELIKALKDQNITEPTQIQEKAIPLVLSGKDVIGMSMTGSGKTAAFGIPLLQNLEPGKGLQVLVMAPTRELANQISQEISKFGKYMKFNITTVFGGVGFEPQIRGMAKADIVVGTPGRLLDHLRSRNIDLSKIRCFVLDEADKMVEMGFIEDVSKILDATPKTRQVLLFGATISNEIERLKKNYMKDPQVARAETRVEEDLLEQYYYNIDHREKFSLLVHLLKKEETGRVLIFCSARSTVELVGKNLRKQGIKSDCLHGKMPQNKRLHIIDRFNHGNTKILVASSVAARGLDIKDITHVFNYDLSQDPQEYIHRIGRTARAGETGKAITLLSDRDHETFSVILSKYSMKVDVLPTENFQKLRFETDRGGNSFGGRGGNRFGGRGSWGRQSKVDFGRGFR